MIFELRQVNIIIEKDDSSTMLVKAVPQPKKYSIFVPEDDRSDAEFIQIFHINSIRKDILPDYKIISLADEDISEKPLIIRYVDYIAPVNGKFTITKLITENYKGLQFK